MIEKCTFHNKKVQITLTIFLLLYVTFVTSCVLYQFYLINRSKKCQPHIAAAFPNYVSFDDSFLYEKVPASFSLLHKTKLAKR